MTTQYFVTWRNLVDGTTREWECVTEQEAVQAWGRAQSLTEAGPISLATSEMREHGLELGPRDVETKDFAFIVDGMPLADWSSAVCAD